MNAQNCTYVFCVNSDRFPFFLSRLQFLIQSLQDETKHELQVLTSQQEALAAQQQSVLSQKQRVEAQQQLSRTKADCRKQVANLQNSLHAADARVQTSKMKALAESVGRKHDVSRSAAAAAEFAEKEKALQQLLDEKNAELEKLQVRSCSMLCTLLAL